MVLVSLAGCYLPGRFMRGYAEAEPEGMKLLSADRAYANAPPSVRGQVRFLFDAFGSLTTDNLDRYGQPWKKVGAAIGPAGLPRSRDRGLQPGVRNLPRGPALRC